MPAETRVTEAAASGVVDSRYYLRREIARGAMDVVYEARHLALERDALTSLGCKHLRGYLFARPGPPFPLAVWP